MSGCGSQVKICEPGGGGILLPLFGDEQEWRSGLRAVLYLLGLLWLFLAVAAVSDIFMGAIEEITSKKKRILAKNGKYFTIKVWNDTVANLTLMALGSSAPEILLSVIELLGNGFYSGDLGPSTIVGSAAFNLFCISAVCVSAIPDNEVRYIKDMNVYMITAVISLLAYLWLYMVVSVISQDIVDIYEGVLTFFYFPTLVGLAFLADKGYLACVREREVEPKVKQQLTNDELVRFSREDGAQLTEEELLKYLGTDSQRLSKAAYRKRAHDQLLHGKPAEKANAKPRSHNFSAVVPADEPPRLQPGDDAAPPMPQAIVFFGGKNFAVLEQMGIIKLPICRTGNSSLTVMVDFCCRDGTAHSKEDYEAIEGTLTFLPDEVEKILEVVIVKDDVPEDHEDFFVELSNPRSVEEGFAALGPNASARVIIVDTDIPSVLYTDEDLVKVFEVEERQEQEVHITVRRKDGCGPVSFKYVTEDGSAVEGHHYQRCEGEIALAQGENTAEIVVMMCESCSFAHKEDFRLILYDATGGAKFDADTDGGEDSCIITIQITPNGVGDFRARTMRALVNWQKTQKGHENWKDQFVNALLVNGGDDEAGPASGVQWALHILTLPWKLIFATIPPVDYCGGWLCFYISLCFIGMVTALISDLAGLVGCVLDLPDFVTAITLVALGTSLPDTFASKAAAEQDPYADASIGNITGSNSVNVFLGLGLPWTIGSIYWAVNGRTSEWQAKYASQARFSEWNTGGGKFIVIGGDLGYSVVIFSCGALLCMSILLLRRKAFGGELGGPRICKLTTAVFLVLIWCTYVVLSSSQSLQSAAAC